MNISEVVYKETEVLQKLVPFDRVGDVSASLGRIEAAVNKRINELSDRLADANETIAEWQKSDARLRRRHWRHLAVYAERITELETTLQSVIDEYVRGQGEYDDRAKAWLSVLNKEEK